MAGEKQGIVVPGLDQMLKDFNKMPAAFNRSLRVAAKSIAEGEVPRLKAAAFGSDRLSAAVGVSVRARSDRVPKIVAGGARRVAVSTRPRAGDVFFGAEFGGGKRKTTRQFRPHQGRKGYWLWPQLRADSDRMQRAWLESVERVLEDMQVSGMGDH